ncbi:MAG: hypothetical protein AB7T17_01415 [Geobacter sp.]
MTGKFLIFAILLAFSISGCVHPQRQPTPEEIEMQQKFMQNFLQKKSQFAQNQNFQSYNQSSIPPKQNATISESDIAKQLENLPKLASGANIIKKKDGFEANGRRHIDPEGKIVKFGSNSHTGDITYLAQVSRESYIIKTMRVGHDPITIATAERSQNGWTVTTVTGKKIVGESVVPLSSGFLVARGAAGFIYSAGKGINNIAIPEDFLIAPFQNGDIQGTRFVLIERRPTDKSNQIGGIFDSVASLGSTLGVNKKEDYALLNIDTGKQILINVSMDGKNESVYSECRKQNSFINSCANIDFQESLFDKYGLPNAGHYYWRISWFNTKTGPILIVTENSLRETIAENLNTGKKATLFSRMLGINYVIVSEKPDGRISATAKMGLDTQSIENIEDFINNSSVAKQ